MQKIKSIDSLWLGIVTILIVLNPYYLRQEINFFELGLYLPGIDSILNGGVPYRDFFHLRGPLELYIPALFMKMFGESVAVLATYFYVGTVLTLLVCVMIGREIFQSRIFYYLVIPVLVVRTFPRVAYTCWGGMRYFIGLLSVWALIKFLKTQHRGFLFAGGVFAGIASQVSIEIGFSAFLAGIFTLWAMNVKKDSALHALFLVFCGGFLAALIPVLAYLHFNSALQPYVEAVCAVVWGWGKMNVAQGVPQLPHEFILAMLNPGGDHFKHITPLYLYVFLALYIYKANQFKVDDELLVLFPLIGYGLTQYFSAFRLIESYQFEMALQPEKLLLFVFQERLVRDLPLVKQRLRNELSAKVNWDCVRMVVLSLIVISSVAYTLQRLNHRFFSFKYVCRFSTGGDCAKIIPLEAQAVQTVDHPRVGRMTVPVWQAQDIALLADFISTYSKPGVSVAMFPEIAAYHFIVQRPFAAKFPDPILSWFKSSWHDKYWNELRNNPPEIVILNRNLSGYFKKMLLAQARNRVYYDDMVLWVKDNYVLMGESPKLSFYALKSKDRFVQKDPGS